MTKNEFENSLDQTIQDIKSLIIQSETEDTLRNYEYREEDALVSIAKVAQYLAVARSAQNLLKKLPPKNLAEVKDNIVPLRSTHEKIEE